MRAWILVVLAACGGAPPPAAQPAAPPPAPSTRAEAEPWRPPPTPPPSRTNRSREQIILDEMPRLRRDQAELTEKRSDLWTPCVRDLVEARDRAFRNELGDALTFYTTKCDREAQHAIFGPPQRRFYQRNSYFGFIGDLTPRTVRIELLFVRRGGPPPERITLIAGAARWTSQKLDALVETDVSSVKLPYTRSVARVLRKMLETDDAIVRFEAEVGSEDMLVTEEMKGDLGVFVELADSLSP